jgi:hypothetical protein
MAYIVIWGLTAITAAVVAGILAVMKNRDYSSWAAWCFLMPPLVIALLLTPKSDTPPRRRRLGDDGDKEGGWL